MEKLLKFGPKRMEGRMWDEGGKSEIVQILLTSDGTEIKSIQFSYAINGKVCRSEIYGQPSDLKVSMVTFDYPSEFLISISGHERLDYENVTGRIYKLASLGFGTNKRSYGPFGCTDEISDPRINKPHMHRKFSYDFGPTPCFAGFYGCVGKQMFGVEGSTPCLSAIGVYVKPINSLSQLNVDKDDLKLKKRKL